MSAAVELRPEVHPAAGVFPMLGGRELAALAEDIAARGLLVPGARLSDGLVLDGRNRAAACELAGVPMRWETYAGDDPVSYVVSVNVRRRHLTDGQRAMLAVELLPLYEAETRRGRPVRTTQIMRADRPALREPPRAREKAAKATGASGRSTAKAKRVKEQAPDLADQVKAGTLALDRAERTIRQRAKAARVAEIAARPTAPLDSLGPFGVIYADPPWRYDFAQDDARRVENHYPTMCLGDIKALGVPAADDSVLFLWTPSPLLREGLETMDAWGFDYVTNMAWVKDRIGMGYYARQQHELLLIGRRGNLAKPDPEDRPSSVISAPRGEHSAKPARVYGLIERMYPFIDKVELFQRSPRDGWAGWGNQT